MRKKNKLEKFSENRETDNIIETGKPLFEKIKGQWNKYFSNAYPIVLELACGKAEYTIGLAEKFKEKNFIGIDIKGDRIWTGSQEASAKGLDNVAFLRTYINYLDDFFEVGEVSEIWLTFPDPRPKDRDEKHRLTNPVFLRKYQQILQKDGWFKFKTDSTSLFEYSLGIIEDAEVRDLEYTRDLYQSDLLSEHHGLKTKYEKIWTEKGEKIKYLKFRF